MNKNILMVMDKESFTKDELKNNKESAYAAAIHLFEFKPLTPPIELIDGKAYQINHKGLESLGFYYRGLFVNNGIEIKESDCTNIQPLTVEVK